MVRTNEVFDGEFTDIRFPVCRPAGQRTGDDVGLLQVHPDHDGKKHHVNSPLKSSDQEHVELKQKRFRFGEFALSESVEEETQVVFSESDVIFM